MLRDLERYVSARDKGHFQVRVGICRLRNVDRLAVVAYVRLGDRRRARVAELARVEQAVAAARCDFRLGRLRAAVVFLRVVRTVDRDRDRKRVDLLVAVRDFEDNIREVRVRVHEHIGSETHVGLTVCVFTLNDIGTGCCRSTVELKVAVYIVEIRARRCGVVAYGMHIAIVRICAVVADDRDGHRNRCDRQRSGVGGDIGVERPVLDLVGERIVMLALRSDVSDVCNTLRRRGDRDLVARRERELDLAFRAFDHIFYRLTLIVRSRIGDGVNIIGMVLTVVRPGLRCGRDLDRHVRRVDLQLAVLNDERDRVVAAVGCLERRIVKAALFKTHRVRARILFRDLCGDAACKTQREAVRLAVVRSAVRIVFDFADELVAVLSEPAVVFDDVAGDGLVLAVVIIFRLVALDGDRQRRLGDRQRAVDDGDVIVLEIVAADDRVGRDDLTAVYADVRLRTVQRDARQCVGALQTFDRDLIRDRDGLTFFAEGDRRRGVGCVALALRRAIVGIALVDDRDRKLRFVDHEPAVGDGERDRLEVRIVVAEVILVEAHRVIADVLLGDRRRTVVDDLARVEQVAVALRFVALDRVVRAVVRLGIRMTGDRDLEVDLFDDQLAGVGDDNVVGGVGRAGLDRRVTALDDQRADVEVAVVVCARVRAGGGGVIDRKGLTFDKTFDLVFGRRAGDEAFDVIAVLLAAVVRERALVDRDGQRSLADHQDADARHAVHGELRGDVVAVRILDDGRTLELIEVCADVDLDRVRRRDAGHGVCDAVHGERDRRAGAAVLNFRVRAGELEARRRVLLAVVDRGEAVRGQRDLELRGAVGDGQGSGHGADRVVVRVGAIVQRVGERVLALTDDRTGTGDVIGRAFAGDEAVARDRDVAVRQRGAVVFLAVGCARQGDGALRDLLITVGDGEGHVEVIVVVRELARRKTHHGLAGRVAVLDHVRTRCARRAGEREVIVHVIQRGACGRGVAADRLFTAVVLIGAVRADDGDGDVDRLDLEAAVLRDHEHDVAEVRVVVREVRGRQVHVVRTRIRLGERRRAAEAEITLVIVRVADGDVVAGDRVRIAVIVDRIRVTGDRDRNGADVGDRHKAVGDAEGHFEVIVVVRKLARRKTHLRRADVGTRRSCRTGEREVRFQIQRIADRNVVAVSGKLAAGVGMRGVVTGDRDGDRALADRHVAVCADRERDVVVRVVVHEVVRGEAHVRGARVGALRFRGLAGLKRDVCGVVARVVRRCGEAACRVFGAVVRLGVVRAGDGNGDRLRRDRERAGNDRHVIVRVVARGDGDGITADVLARRMGEGVVDRVAVFSAGDRCRQRRILLAVDLGLVVRGDRDRLLGDLEVAGLIDDRVVALRGLAARRDHVVTDVLARFTRDRIGDRVIADKTGDRCVKGRIVCAVGLALVVCLDGDLLCGDRQSAGRGGDSIIGRNSRRGSRIGLASDARTDGQRIADRRVDRRFVARKRAGHGVGTGKRAAVVRLRSRRRGDGQRQGVVYDNDVLARSDRDRLRRVVAVCGEVIAGEAAEERRRRVCGVDEVICLVTTTSSATCVVVPLR